jgi:calcium channel MID1
MLCKCPHLTPLQSRFAASLLALTLLAIVFWSLSTPHFAYAAQLDPNGAGESRHGEDHNWHRIEEERLAADGIESDTGAEILAVRQEKELDEAPIRQNNAAESLNIDAGQTERWVFSEKLLHGAYGEQGAGLPTPLFVADYVEPVVHGDLRRRDEDGGRGVAERQASSEPRSVYISMNTCLQPTYNGTDTQRAPPPQLSLYVATSASNKNPGPGSGGDQTVIVLDEGFAQINITATTDVHMAVHAPQLPPDFTGIWNYDIAVSIDDFYHQARNDTPFLFLIDTDTTAALMVTDNLTQADADSAEYTEWMEYNNPPLLSHQTQKKNTSSTSSPSPSSPKSIKK